MPTCCGAKCGILEKNITEKTNFKSWKNRKSKKYLKLFPLDDSRFSLVLSVHFTPT